jgi:hypothetical protein
MVMPFDGRHFTVVVLAYIIGCIAGAIYGWILKGEKQNDK